VGHGKNYKKPGYIDLVTDDELNDEPWRRYQQGSDDNEPRDSNGEGEAASNGEEEVADALVLLRPNCKLLTTNPILGC